MEGIIDYFAEIPSVYRTIFFVLCITLFWVLEGTIPLFRFEYRKFIHALKNLTLNMLQLLIGLGLASVLLLASDFTTQTKFGILYVLGIPLWAHVILGILLLDLIGAYFIHWVEHKVKWMWKFHLVHHTDRSVDVTTGLRHHPGETIFRITFTLLAVIIAGVPMGVIIIYQTLSVIFAQITHANIKVPKVADRVLSWIFVTPNMHKVHHHYTQPYTDTNYGNIFSIWDRIFGTFAEKDVDSLVYGIDTHMNPKENDDLINLLEIPFQKYRAPKGSKFSDDEIKEKLV
jgi:sterol desaturase/sphingolipid hydroxylase (fatty acid hydroxylase superfamily)